MEENVEDRKVENWVAAAREKMSKLLAYSATRYTRILLISDVDQTLSKQVFREDKRARKVVFMEEPLSGPGWDGKNNCVEGGFDGENAFRDRIMKHKPNVLIIASKHYRRTFEALREGGFIKIDLNGSPWAITAGPGFYIIEAMNVWQLEDCFLTATTVSTGRGVGKQMHEMRAQGVIGDSDLSAVICGGHGTTEEYIINIDCQVEVAGGCGWSRSRLMMNSESPNFSASKNPLMLLHVPTDH